MIFSEVKEGEIILSRLGKIINEEWLKTPSIRDYIALGEYVIMPNHFHGIFFIHKNSDEPELLSPSGSYLYFEEGFRNRFGPQRHNIASVVRGIKSAVTQRAKVTGITNRVWQRNYYEHIIRNQVELEQISLYIRENPFNWESNENHPSKYLKDCA